MKSQLFVDVHVLETVPPSCINRDDSGSPKTAIYGGKTRARVSSQAWKKAVRDTFKKMYSSEEIGFRTKKVVGLVQNQIKQLKEDILDDEAEKLAIKALENAGLKIKNPESGTDALIFMSEGQARALAELILASDTDKKNYKNALKDHPSFDMALFGRMVASDAELNWDATCQVAHAISTHEAITEYDYFTAVDDLDTESAASAHIGTSEFNSSTLYRYATINVNQLFKAIGQQTPEVVKGFIDAFVKSMPTGKENSYANRVLPGYVYVTLREDLPLSLVGAFEEAVHEKYGYLKPSIVALEKTAKDLYLAIADQPKKGYVTTIEESSLVDEKLPFKELLSQVEEQVKDYISEVE